MEGLLPAVEGLWPADAGSVAVADSCKGKKKKKKTSKLGMEL